MVYEMEIWDRVNAVACDTRCDMIAGWESRDLVSTRIPDTVSILSLFMIRGYCYREVNIHNYSGF